MCQDTRAEKSVVLINTQDFPGGAAASTRRLKQALLLHRYAAHILVGRRNIKDHDTRSFDPLPDTALAAAARDQGLLYYHLQGSHRLIRHPLVRRAVLLHLQNVHGEYFNPYSIPALSRYKPTVWTLHDMWALTGHCAHALGCPKWEWEADCGGCPDLAVYPSVSRDATARLWQDKRTIYEYSRLWVVCPSQWLADKVIRSILRPHPVTVIMNAVDIGIFRPLDQKIARRKLGLPEDAVIMGTAADGGLHNPWKGKLFALEAALALHKAFPSVLFVAAGGAGNAAADCIRCLPHLNSEREMALYHSCLDFTLFTSIYKSSVTFINWRCKTMAKTSLEDKIARLEADLKEAKAMRHSVARKDRNAQLMAFGIMFETKFNKLPIAGRAKIRSWVDGLDKRNKERVLAGFARLDQAKKYEITDL